MGTVLNSKSATKLSKMVLYKMNDVVKNAVTCTICGSPADLHNKTYYQCQKNSNHVGDTWVGIFTDLSMGIVKIGEHK